MGWWHHGWGLGLGGWEVLILGGLMMLLFWGGLFALVFFAIRAAYGGRRVPDARSTDPAISILSERFAKGEISAEEYREMKAVLDG